MFSIALLLLCFNISNLSTRIFVAVTSVMVAALIGWCIRTAWESSAERGVWLSNLLPSVTRALGHIRAMCHRVFPSADIRIRRENPSLLVLDHAGSVHPMSDREGVEVVAV